MLMILVKSSAGSIRHSRSLFGKERILRHFQINHKTICPGDSSSGGTACTSGRGFDPAATRMRSTLLSCLGLFQILLAQVHQMSLNVRILNVQYDTEMVRILSQSFCEGAWLHQD